MYASNGAKTAVGAAFFLLGLGFTHGLGMVLALLHVIDPIQAAFFHAVPDLLILANAARMVI